MQPKLDGWRTRCLSRARRITLAQSVLSSLPIFHMQLEKLPYWVHRALDRAMRCCVWGGAKGKRGVHLIKLGVLTRPKKSGSISLKSTKGMNWAMNAKLTWRLFS